jgi:phenylalanyl-tRNA synthetase beta chain
VLLDTPLRRDALEVLGRHPAELTPDADFIDLEITDPDLCPRYSAAFIQGVRMAPSPYWMQTRLRAAGVRPINNIVDVTNYVMLELGQPLHAFDYHVLRRRPGGKRPVIDVRRAAPGEQMRTLDGQLRTFDGEMLLITDGGGPVAVAGVMGGLDSEVTELTKDVLLESANFHFLNVRRTSRLLGLPTEASQRFGRRVDPELTVAAALRAAHLMVSLAGGTVAPVVGDVYPGRRPQRVIEFDPAYAHRILGVDVPTDEVVRILSSLEFQVSRDEGAETLTVTVPSHRQDVSEPVDLVEEVGRIWGYDRFPTTLVRDALPPQRANPRVEGSELVRDILVGCGLDEVITYSLVSIEDEQRLWPHGSPPDVRQYLRVRNPLSDERVYLRQTLLSSLLRNSHENLRFVDRLGIFEIGAVYLPVEGQALPHEPLRLCIVMTGPREGQSWLAGQDRSAVGFYDIKGVAETLSARLHREVTFEPGEHPALHPGRRARVRFDGEIVGTMGELHPLVREAFHMPAQPVCVLECELDGLLVAQGTSSRVSTISSHPPVYEDLSIVVDGDVPAVRVRDLIAQTGGSLVRSVLLFDVYQGEQVEAGRKSLAYRLTYQADDRTLTDQKVAKLRTKIVHRLERELGATLRG